MQVILDSYFARPDSAPIWGGKKGEFRDWTRVALEEIKNSTPHIHYKRYQFGGRQTKLEPIPEWSPKGFISIF